MELSVVVPTLNGRERLTGALDSLAAAAPEAEVVVVNGPSADGTTGMVRDRDDVDVLVEVADRSVNVARNAGIEVAGGDAIAFLGFDLRVGADWVKTIVDGLANAHVVTGPVEYGDHGTEEPERRTIAGRAVQYFSRNNVAFRRATLRDALDGFDEYLQTGGARDTAHRLAGAGYGVGWRDAMATEGRPEGEDDEAGPTPMGPAEQSREWKYRALSYRLVKNYGLRPTVARRVFSHGGADAGAAAKAVLSGESSLSAWFGTGREVLTGIVRGSADGLTARARDRSDRRNPYGLSHRSDRAVATYDWR